MESVLARFLANAAALAVATWLVPGIRLGDGDTTGRVVTILVVAVIFGFVNTIVKPVFRFVSSPVVLVTLGAFLLVINAALLMLTGWFADQVGLAWHVDSFGAAFLGSIVVSVVSFVVNAILGREKRKRKESR